MAKKKYIKDSRGMTVSVTTETLGLEKPLLNENYDIDVHNRNMDKIDEDLKPIDDSYIIELFQHDGDTTNPRDYYTKVEADEKFATKEEANNALNKANEAFQRGDNVKAQLVDKLISEGLNVSTNNTFEELINGIALGKKIAQGVININASTKAFNKNYSIDLDFSPSVIFVILSAVKNSDSSWEITGDNTIYTNLYETKWGRTSGSYYIVGKITQISKTGFYLSNTGTSEGNLSDRTLTYYAFE